MKSLGWLLLLYCSVGLSLTSPTIVDDPSLQALGWQHDSASQCQGYYIDPPLLSSIVDQKPLTIGKMRITGESIRYSNTDPSLLEHVIIEEPNRRVTADQAWLIRDKHTHKIVLIKAYGHVRVFQAGKAILADHTIIHLDHKSAEVQNLHYRLAMGEQQPHPTPFTLTGLVAHGEAQSAQQLGPNHYQFEELSYTTCSPLKPSWHVDAKKLHLDQDSGRGEVRDGHLYIGKVPIAYLPYWDFPIDKRRESGFLTPRYSFSSVNGFGIMVPYYLNLAPNLDDQIMPQYYSKRGLLALNQTRYLTQSSSGSLLLADINHDPIFRAFQLSAPTLYHDATTQALNDLTAANTSRHMISWQQQTRIDPALTASVDYNHTSDDYFQQDFALPAASGNLTNQLLQRESVDYSTTHWQINQTLQQYQTLHPIDLAATMDQYRELPAISIHGEDADKIPGLDLSVDAQFVHFDHDQEFKDDPFSNLPYAIGDRYHLAPQLSIPYYRFGGYVIPSFQADLSEYALLKSELASGGTGANLTRNAMTRSRALPLFDVDSGLTFTRHMTIGQHAYQQTIEPRVFYLYVPYQDQSDLPIFDTMLPVINYQQMFMTNRFVGIDRIGDANQIATGITSRLLQENGNEAIHVSIGQITYFQPRLVTLCSTPGCVLSEDPQYRSHTSDLASEITSSLPENYSITANLAWNPTLHNWDNRTFTLAHHGPYNYSVSYSDQNTIGLNALMPTVNSRVQLININTNLPIVENWSFLGSASKQYEVNHDDAEAYYFGIQYDTCCLAVQILAGRNFVGYDPNNRSEYDKRVYLQLLLKGIGAVGSLPAGNGIADYSGYLTNNRTL